MILNFSEQIKINGEFKKTNFVKKIIEGTKIHTIREDANNRWMPGKIIHFSTGARTKNYKCFKTDICLSVQPIYINKYLEIWIDNLTLLSEEEVEQLAINDGFDNVEGFWSWFKNNLPFSGNLIHWTEKTY